ncbi:hypothetical protein [Methylobacterium sp. ID0610]|uniref:hypothetical protein n=1 Tax=Methylobacterium carpenticola TaxID=3344827 RepID=UPI00368CCE23
MPETVIHHATSYADHRLAEYPSVGDQLDALSKIALALEAQGIVLPPDAMAVVHRCADIKARYRKPTNGETHG